LSNSDEKPTDDSQLVEEIVSEKEIDNREKLFIVDDVIKKADETKASFFKRTSIKLKTYLWTKFINRDLFYCLNIDDQESDKPKISIYSIPLVKLIGLCILS
jgi:hypothetical protein